VTGAPGPSNVAEFRFDMTVLELGLDPGIDLLSHEFACDHARILLGSIAAAATLHGSQAPKRGERAPQEARSIRRSEDLTHPTGHTSYQRTASGPQVVPQAARPRLGRQSEEALPRRFRSQFHELGYPIP
jgi:hypothetical protein